MADRPLSVSEATRMLDGLVSAPNLYKWIGRGTVASERGPNGRIRVRESEVQRLLAWFNGEITGDFPPPKD